MLEPALKGEGEWKVLFSLGKKKRPVVWGMSIRPFTTYGSVVATAAVFDQSRLHAAMFNGSDVPGGGPWINADRVPDRAMRSLIAAFNGGFRFEHDPGGYVTEGVTVREMKKGYATIGIDANGVLHVGVWGDDMHKNDGWVSLRQNLPPVPPRERFREAVELCGVESQRAPGIAESVEWAKALVALTESGSTALWMSRHRIHIPIYALTSKLSTQRKMALYRNVRPLLMESSSDRDTALRQAEEDLKKRGVVRSGDIYAITCGEPMGSPGGTNMLKICRVD